MMPHAVLQRRAAAPAPAHVPESVREVLRRPGQPLPERTRRAMEARFGHDFSRVRIHTDATAERSARDTRAEAWTVGRDIAFGANRWQPGTAGGERLLVHELTHVLQQNGAAVSPGADLQVSNAGEREASAAEAAARPGHSFAPAAPSVRRKGAAPAGPETATKAPSLELRETVRKMYWAIRWGGAHTLIELLAAARGGEAKAALAAAYKEYASPYGTNADLRRDMITEMPRNGTLVDALALLRHEKDELHLPHVVLAHDIIPTAVADDSALTNLKRRPRAERARLEENYNATFWGLWHEMRGPGCPTTEDGLLMHLHYSLCGWLKLNWRFEKCWALLDRDLNEADNIYFDSVGIPDAHRDSLVARFQKIYLEQGFRGITELHMLWNGYIRSTDSWQRHKPPKPWTTEMLDRAMESEVGHSPQTWGPINAIFEEYNDWMLRPYDFTPAEKKAAEDRELQQHLNVEARTLDASKGAVHFFNNRDQLIRAARRTRELQQKRLARLQPGTKEWNDVNASYQASRRQAMGGVRQQWIADDGTRIAMEAALAPSLDAGADFNLADEFYSAREDYDQLLSLAAKYWVQGRIWEAWQQAGQAKPLGPESEPRPAFELDRLIPRQYVAHFLRFEPLVSRRFNKLQLMEPGADHLQAFINLGRDGTHSDTKLAEVVKFFNTPGFTADKRAEVIKVWEERHYEREAMQNPGSVSNGTTPVDRFLKRMATVFEGHGNNWLDLANVVDPVNATTNPEKAAERANLRLGNLRSKWYNPRSFTRAAYDAVTGENLLEHVEANASRLNFIAQQYRTNPEALAMMLQMSGSSVQALAAQNFEISEEQAAALKEMQNACAEMFASALEIALDAVVGAVTGGAGAAPLLKSLAVAMAGMLAREGMLGSDYQLMSGANVKALINTVQSFAFLRVDVRKKVADRWSNKTMPIIGRIYDPENATRKSLSKVLAGFVQCGAQKAVEGGISTTTGMGLDAIIMDKAFSPRDLANAATNLFVSMFAGGVGGMAVINNNPGVVNAMTNPATLFSKAFYFRAGLGANGVGKQISAVLQGGLGDKTIYDVLGSISGAYAKTLATAFVTAPFDAEDTRREMQRTLRFMATLVRKDPADLVTLARDQVEAKSKTSFRTVNGVDEVARPAHHHDQKLKRAYADHVKDAEKAGRPPLDEHTFLMERAAKNPADHDDLISAYKPGVEKLNDDASVRSGPIWTRNEGGKLEDLQRSWSELVTHWSEFGGLPEKQ